MKAWALRGWMAVTAVVCALAAGPGYVRGTEPVPRFVANSYVNLGTPSALQIPSNNPLTVEGWVKFDTLTATAMLYSKNNARSAAPYTYMFGLTGTGKKMAAHTGAGGDPANTWREATLPTGVTTGRWYHLAFVCDGAYVSFYLDGFNVGAQPFSFGNTESHTVKIGGYNTTTDIEGNISDVRVWNHARTAAQIKNFMNRRLNGVDAGLLGYWPMNEGTGTVVDDGTGANDGTFSGAVTWVTATDLTLTAASDEFIHAMPFSLAHPVTGSTRFTNSNRVDVAPLPVPNGCDYYQITASGDATSIDANGWLLTNVPPAQQTFVLPITETNVQFYAWFTNTTAATLAHRAEASIFYTEALPVPTTRVALAIQQLPGRDVIVNGADLDAGSVGGQADGKAMAIERYDAVCANPGDDQTPTESFATLATTGVYPLLLRVRNEAGSTVLGTATCLVTVTAATIDTNTWTGAGGNDLWHNPANWSAGVPAASQNVAVLTGSGVRLTRATAPLNSFLLAASQTLTVEGWESSLKAVTMTINGTVTHANNDGTPEDWVTWRPQHRILLEGSNITVSATAKLDTDWKGYPKLMGPGRSLTTRDGGGHAGLGGSGYLGAGGGGLPYGDPVEPVQPGSGGGEPSAGREGGGVIRVVAEGHLAILGSLSANGRPGTYSHGGGGSGGSIWLNCRTFGGTATGLVQANGGNGQSQGGGGSGGRLALHYDGEAQAALASPVPPVRFFGAAGAKGPSVQAVYPAAMGTLYLPDTLFVTENIDGQRFWHVRLTIPAFTEWSPQTLTLNNCVLGLPEGFRLAVTDDLLLTNNAALHFFAASVADPLTEDGATVTVGGDLVLVKNSWIYPYASDTDGASVGFNIAGDLTVEAGCGFNADDLGFRWQTGPGGLEARFTELGTGLGIRSSSGTGYGGGGGNGWDCGGCLGYGEAQAPRWPGTGSRMLYSARGGGAIRLVVSGHAEISGLLTATGSRGNGGTDYGSASGGSIWLNCRTLGGAATGLLNVNGGNAGNIDGAGGGGRIAVFYDAEAQASAPVPGCAFAAAGGARGSASPQRGAEMGTLYLPDTLLVQALAESGRFQKVRLVIPGFTQWSPASLTLDGGEFILPAGFDLNVAGNMTMLSGAAIHLQATATNTPGSCGAQLTVGGDLHLAANAWIYPYAEWTNGAVVGIRVAGDVTIDAGGGIDADGRGYTPKSNNLNGTGAGKDGLSGGGYGGKGGGTKGGVSYGDAALPLQPGSPAGWFLYGSGLRSGQGGGAIRLLAGGNVHLDGILSANAMPKELSYGGTGASGGAIFVAARRLTGNGVMRASGTLNYSRAKADGGGGRIAVWVGLPLATVEAKIAAADAGGLAPKMSWKPFTGSLEALRASDEAEDGTADIYAVNSTLFLIR